MGRRLLGTLLLRLSLLLSACRGAVALLPPPTDAPAMATAVRQESAPSVTPGALPLPREMPTPSATPRPSDTPAPSPTPTPPPTSTPDPYDGLTIRSLRERAYGGAALLTEEHEATAAFTRYLITYPSDGLSIHGFMNVPHGDGPFPVAVVLHGYIPPAQYQTLAYTTRYADALARAGYLVLHPNLRNFPPSDQAEDRFRVGSAVDVLNLLALVRAGAGQPGPLERADGERIGLMGHSMGGGIALRVLTVDPAVRAAVLYAAMSADERTNYEQIRVWSGGARGAEELAIPEDDLRRISPASYLGEISAAVSIHHSTDDQTVPYRWSEDLCQRLTELGVRVECHTYSATPHTFRGEADRLFIERMVAFLDQYVKG